MEMTENIENLISVAKKLLGCFFDKRELTLQLYNNETVEPGHRFYQQKTVNVLWQIS